MSRPLTDEQVLAAIAKIVSSSYPDAAKCEMLETLWFAVGNYHPRGMAADVLTAVSEAQNAILYPDWEGNNEK